MIPEWRQFELHCADLLGLDSTPRSGGTWHSPGDCVGHPLDDPFPLMAECKHTTRISTTLRLKLLRQWARLAADTGRRFCMPIRLAPQGSDRLDVVVLLLDDFAELLCLARGNADAEK